MTGPPDDHRGHHPDEDRPEDSAQDGPQHGPQEDAHGSARRDRRGPEDPDHGGGDDDGAGDTETAGPEPADSAPADPRPDLDVDREWERIVAGLDRWPSADPDASSEISDRPVEPPSTGRPVAEAPPARSLGPRDHVVEDDPEDFVPPDPPALGSGNPGMVLSMIGAAGAPIILLVASIVWRSMPGWFIGALVTAFVAGVAGLVVSLPRDRDRRDEGPDDGARV